MGLYQLAVKGSGDIRVIRLKKLHIKIAGIALVFIIIIALIASGSIGAGFNAAVRPIAYVRSSVGNAVYGIFNYKAIQRENEDLKNTVKKLTKKQSDEAFKKDDISKLEQLSSALNYKKRKDVKPVTANVLTFDNAKGRKILTIDRGRESGISEGDTVESIEGLVGKVSSAGYGFSKVTPIVDSNDKVSFKVFRDLKIAGVISGSENGKLNGYVIDDKMGIIKRDLLLTTGLGKYPRGISIGTVEYVNYDRDLKEKTIRVKPSVKFMGLDMVVVYPVGSGNSDKQKVN